MPLALHETRPLLQAGTALAEAGIAVVLMHGRGAPAEDILSLHTEFDVPGVVYLAPSALNNSWYPNSFLAPVENNQPFLDSALNTVSLVLAEIKRAGIAPEKTVLAGFSQGACLTLEFAARRGIRFGGIVGMSGGVIGPDGATRSNIGLLEGMPVYLGAATLILTYRSPGSGKRQGSSERWALQ